MLISNYKEFSMCSQVEQHKRLIFKQFINDIMGSGHIKYEAARTAYFKELDVNKLNKVVDYINNAIFVSVQYDVISDVDYEIGVLTTYALHIGYMLSNIFQYRECEMKAFVDKCFDSFSEYIDIAKKKFIKSINNEMTPEAKLKVDIYCVLYWACGYLEQEMNRLIKAMFNFENEEVEDNDFDEHEDF